MFSLIEKKRIENCEYIYFAKFGARRTSGGNGRIGACRSRKSDHVTARDRGLVAVLDLRAISNF